MADAESLRVEVAYARADVQVIVPLALPAGATVATAFSASRLTERFAEIDPQTVAVGVFGRVCPRDTVLHDGDRVEIYRPLLADPKEVRKQRAAQGKRMRKGGGEIEPDAAP